MEFAKKELKKETITREELEKRLANWPESYYLERDPEVRKVLLDAADEAGLTPKENEFRRKLYGLRYKKADTGIQDKYLGAWLGMKFLTEQSGGLFGNKYNPKKVKKLLDPIGFEDLSDAGAEMLGDDILYRSVLYEELHHLGRLYIALCQEDRGYNSVLLGFGKISPESQVKKIASEVRKVGIGVIEDYKPGDKYGIWTRAVTTAFADTFPEYTDLLENQ